MPPLLDGEYLAVCVDGVDGVDGYRRWIAANMTVIYNQLRDIGAGLVQNKFRVNQTRNIYFLQIIIHPAISAGCTQPGIPALLAAWPVSGLGVSVCFSTISWPGH